MTNRQGSINVIEGGHSVDCVSFPILVFYSNLSHKTFDFKYAVTLKTGLRVSQMGFSLEFCNGNWAQNTRMKAKIVRQYLYSFILSTGNGQTEKLAKQYRALHALHAERQKKQ